MGPLPSARRRVGLASSPGRFKRLQERVRRRSRGQVDGAPDQLAAWLRHGRAEADRRGGREMVLQLMPGDQLDEDARGARREQQHRVDLPAPERRDGGRRERLRRRAPDRPPAGAARTRRRPAPRASSGRTSAPLRCSSAPSSGRQRCAIRRARSAPDARRRDHRGAAGRLRRCGGGGADREHRQLPGPRAQGRRGIRAGQHDRLHAVQLRHDAGDRSIVSSGSISAVSPRAARAGPRARAPASRGRVIRTCSARPISRRTPGRRAP